MTTFSLSLLGPFQATLDGDLIAGLTSAKARALLAYLAVEADRPHPRQALAALLWPEHSESRARANLSQTLFLLHGTLVGDAGATPLPLLCVTAQSVQFNRDPAIHVDVAAFTALLSECAHHRHARPAPCAPCLARLERAAALYRGRFLENIPVTHSAPYEEWATLEQEHLHLKAVDALRSLAEGLERRGEVERALEHARRQVDLDPWREEAQRQLMGLLALSGRRSEALRQYELCRCALARELAAEPSAETNRLYDEIRSGAWHAPGRPL